jgi:exosortase F-associated protein
VGVLGSANAKNSEMRKVGGISILVAALVAVRVLETHLFYDPFEQFFHQPDYSIQELPEFQWFKFVGSALIRYGINGLITLGIVQWLFEKWELTRFAGIVMGVVFLVLFPVFVGLILDGDSEKYQFLFYVRRILIHPVLALLLIPAIWYNEKFQKAENQ